uniref:Uncharacterized protein n=1 Tax=Nymphaea colorata TaxID=210225 RepID=A0A5K1BCI2_9MAGN
MTDAKGRKPVHAASTKKQMDHVHNAIDKFTRKDNLDASSDEFSILATRSSISEKEREELILLREQVEELKRKLMEKEEELKSAEESMNRFSLAVTEIDDLKRQIEEKDSLVRSAHLQLNEAKVLHSFPEFLHFPLCVKFLLLLLLFLLFLFYFLLSLLLLLSSIVVVVVII